MLSGMEDSILGIWVAHGEGKLVCPDEKILENIVEKGLAPIFYIDDKRVLTSSKTPSK